ncbi:MAG TPA: GldG family protein [Opitutaceae bacterium]|nr:GldG family protein [Opitutaceae bacterium]
MLPIESYRAARWLRTTNLVLQAVFFLTLFAGLNYLALHYHWRFDLSQHRRYSLSPETVSYLRELTRPVRIVVTLTPDSDNADAVQAYHDVQNLLREYVYITAGNYDARADRDGRIKVDYLDVYKNRREADALGVDQPDVILFLCPPDNRRTVRLNELYEYTNGRRTSFKAEQTITAALLDVSNPERKKICFLTGHGEMSPDDVSPVRGLSVLREELRLRNFDVEGLDLSITRRVPEGVDLILICSPQGRFQPFEEELLRQYLTTRAGRIILTLDPAHDCGLNNLFYDWGVRVDDDVILDTNPEFITDNSDLMIRNRDASHPVTKSLVDYNLPLRISLPRSVRPDPDRPPDRALKVTVLAASSPGSWGEFGFRVQPSPVFDAGSDLRGPLGIVVASERVSPGSMPLSVPGGRLIVIGSGDIFSNRRLADSGCQALSLNAVNWAVDRDTQLHFPPRPIERFQLSLSQEQLAKLRLGLLFALPGVAGLLGFVVYWTRRR